MSLTFMNGPLAPDALDTVNYEIHGPKHKILFSPFPRRIRAVFGGETLVDTDNAMLLHEGGSLPVAYFPIADVRLDMLTKTEHSTHCPFKGDASYWTVTTAGRTSENSVWGYENPIDGASWLEGYVAMYWDHIDQWFDEDEEVFVHLRDPYHRVDVRRTSRRVRVSVAGSVVADTTSARILSETGFPNRYYIPADDVRVDRLAKSQTTSHCPYKGDTDYWNLTGDNPVADLAWRYPAPLDEAVRIAGHWSFYGDDVSVEVT